MLEPVGFWSYARHDDARNQGQLSQLRAIVGDAIGLQYGAEVTLWQDIAAIPFGVNWSETIEETLGQTTFFMPIVTPRFLKSENCREEYVAFRRRMADLGRNDLIFPVHYVTVEHMHPEDTVFGDDLATLRSHQWIDFRPHFYADPTSSDVRRWAGGLAASILKAMHRPLPARTPKTDAVLVAPSPRIDEPAKAVMPPIQPALSRHAEPSLEAAVPDFGDHVQAAAAPRDEDIAIARDHSGADTAHLADLADRQGARPAGGPPAVEPSQPNIAAAAAVPGDAADPLRRATRDDVASPRRSGAAPDPDVVAAPEMPQADPASPIAASGDPRGHDQERRRRLAIKRPAMWKMWCEPAHLIGTLLIGWSIVVIGFLSHVLAVQHGSSGNIPLVFSIIFVSIVFAFAGAYLMFINGIVARSLAFLSCLTWVGLLNAFWIPERGHLLTTSEDRFYSTITFSFIALFLVACFVLFKNAKAFQKR